MAIEMEKFSVWNSSWVWVGSDKGGQHEDGWWESSPALRQGGFLAARFFTVYFLYPVWNMWTIFRLEIIVANQIVHITIEALLVSQ